MAPMDRGSFVFLAGLVLTAGFFVLKWLGIINVTGWVTVPFWVLQAIAVGFVAVVIVFCWLIQQHGLWLKRAAKPPRKNRANIGI